MFSVLKWGLGLYAAVAALFFAFHIIALPMVTPALAACRSAVWPIFWATGWPHGRPIGIPFEGYDDD